MTSMMTMTMIVTTMVAMPMMMITTKEPTERITKLQLLKIVVGTPSDTLHIPKKDGMQPDSLQTINYRGGAQIKVFSPSSARIIMHSRRNPTKIVNKSNNDKNKM